MFLRLLATRTAHAVQPALVPRTRGVASLASAMAALSLARPRSLPSVARAPSLALQMRANAGTKKKKLKPVQLRREVKVASKRKGKHYKLKNHRGALSRWLIKSPRIHRGPVFKRAQAGTSHLNRKNRAWKSKSKRTRVEANAQQKKLLRRLIPYHRKKYMR